jgi:hypothetical protein
MDHQTVPNNIGSAGDYTSAVSMGLEVLSIDTVTGKYRC